MRIPNKINRPTTPLQRYRAQARELILRKRIDLAEPILRNILAIEPNDPVANRQLASCLLRLRRLDAALEQARRAVALSPTAPSALAVLAGIHATRSEHELAINLHMEALAQKADYWVSHFGLADSCAQLARWRESLDWSKKGLALNLTHCGMMRVRAQALAALGKTEEALDAMQEFLRLEPDTSESHAAAGTVLRLLKQPEESAEYLHRALAMNPASPQTHKALAFLFLNQKKSQEAKHHFEQALALQPGLKSAMSGLIKAAAQPIWLQITAHFKEKEYARAEPLLRQLLEIAPDHLVAPTHLAIALIMQLRYEESLEQARAAVVLRPNFGHARFVLGTILREMDRIDEGLAEGLQALRLQPEKARYRTLPAFAHVDRESYIEAISAINEGVALESAQPTLIGLLAVSLAGLGKNDEASDTISKILATEPEDAAQHVFVGWAYRLMKQYALAETHCRRAIELDTTGRKGFDGLGLAYFEQQKFAEAKPVLETALRNNLYSRRVKNALAVINAAERNPSSS